MSFGIFILCIIVIIGVVSYQKYSVILKKNAEEYNFQLTKQVKENIDYYIRQMDAISNVIQSDGRVQSYFSSDYTQKDKSHTTEEIDLQQLFQSFSVMRNDIVSIFIFGYDGKIISSNPNQKIKPYVQAKDFEWYQRAQQNNGMSIVTSSHVNTLVENPRWVVSLSRELQSIDHKQKKGILLIDLNYQVLEEICSRVKLGSKGYIFIADNNGDIVYHPDQQLVYSHLKEEKMRQVLKLPGRSFIVNEGGERKVYTVSNSELTGWKIVSVNNMNDIFMDEKESRDFIYSMIFISMLLAMLIAIGISTWISNPIKQLEKSMKQVENGNLDFEINTRYKHEVGRLGKSFNVMTRKIKQLMEQIVEEQKMIRKSELKVLQAQINPHFLYNTLDSIIWMAEGKRNEEVVEMTSSLAKLFRISLSKGQDIITVKEEIEHVRNYLVIQKMRYRSKLDFIIEVENDILRYKIIKLILQPLVENAIYHGIKNKSGKGLIKIFGKKINDNIILEVIDNGVGMNPEKLNYLYFGNYDRTKSGNGVGIQNVQERLKLYFGEEYGLSYQSEENIGTTVCVIFPITE